MNEVDDVNRLIRELNEGPAPAAGADTARLGRWLEHLHARGGSDLLLVAGAPPSVRVDGAVLPMPGAPLAGEEIEEAVLPGLSPALRARFAREGSADASYRLPGIGRFRINLHRERGRAAAAIRALPARPPRLASLISPSVDP